MTEKEYLKSVHVRLTPQHYKKLKKMENNGTYPSIAEAIRDAIRYFLKESE